MIRPGEFDQRVEWQPAPDFASAGTLAAKVVSSAFAESVLGEMRDAHDLTIQVRYHPTITAGDRLVWRGNVHEITGIRHLGRRERLEITARCQSWRVLA